MRFASGDEDNYKDDHYATLGVKPSDSIETIRKAGNALRLATHSDHNKGIDIDKFIKVSRPILLSPNPLPLNPGPVSQAREKIEEPLSNADV